MSTTLLQGHVLEVLKTLQPKSVHCAVTSPPYWNLRNYQTQGQLWPAVSYPPMAGLPEVSIAGCDPECEHIWGDTIKTGAGSGGSGAKSPKQTTSTGSYHNGEQGQFCQLCGGWRGSLGLEPTVEMFVGHLVLIFREVYRVLRDDAVLFLNLGDSFKDKQLLGIPWRVAFALQADGWYLRSDIIWHKKNPMPESVRDRPTKAHEYLFLLAKSKKYFYDAEAIKEPNQNSGVWGRQGKHKMDDERAQGAHGNRSAFKPKTLEERQRYLTQGRNRRTVWTLSSEPVKMAHFAVFPTKLVEPCILAGTSEAGVCGAKITKLRIKKGLSQEKRQAVIDFLKREKMI